MNPEAQEKLDGILKRNPESLTPDEVAFLIARRTYLTNEQLRIFAPVLGEFGLPTVAVVSDALKAEEEKPAKTAYKKVETKETKYAGDGLADPDKVE